MSQMMWQAGFVGRDADLRVLQAAWEDARQGTPRVLALVAESGFGKTRLAQEFYNWLSVTQDGRDGAGYWPDQLLRMEDNLRVNPEIVNPDSAETPMPFLWWGLRLADPGGRNATAQSAFAGGLEALTPHLATMQAATERAAVKRRRLLGGGATAADVAVGVTETLVDTLSSVATFGLLGLGKTLVEAALEDRKAARELQMLDAQDLSPVAAGARARDTLAETAVADLGRLCKTPPKGIAAVPLVILVDDIQWIGADAGTASFLTLLLDRARAESWPLLLVLTSWRREWRASVADKALPGALADPARGDIALDLGPVVGLEAIIERALPCLPPDQVTALSRKAEGMPRLLDEMLMYLQRRRKVFVNRDPAAALTEDGLADVLARDFADFVADRLHAAPEHVRRALALASTQGVSFSPRLVRRLAEGLRIVDAETGLQEGDDPHSFVTGALLDEGNDAAAEFRLGAYRDAAWKDLGNLLNEAEVEDHLRAALLAVGADPGMASDQELALVLDAVYILNEDIDDWRPMIFAAGAELVWRARAAHDSRKAGTLAEALLPHIDHLPLFDYRAQIATVLGSAMDWVGHHRMFDAPLRALYEAISDHPDTAENPDRQRFLLQIMSRRSGLVEFLDGAGAALDLRLTELRTIRSLTATEPSAENRRELAGALLRLSDVLADLEQRVAAKEPLEEALRLTQTLAEEAPSQSASREYAITLGRMGLRVRQTIGAKAALTWSDQEVAILRTLAARHSSPESYTDLGRALLRKAQIVERLQGASAARPLLQEALHILRAVTATQPTPDLKVSLAQALVIMAQGVEELDDSSAALPLLLEAEGLFRAVLRTNSWLTTRKDLARTLAALGGVVQALEGDTAAVPMRLEAVALHRAVALKQPTRAYRRDLAESLWRLADLRMDNEDPAAILPLVEEAEQLVRDLARDRPSQNDLFDLANGLDVHARTLAQLGRFDAAKDRWTEALAVMERVASEEPEVDTTPWTVAYRFSLLSMTLIGLDPWARAFVYELIPPVPHPVMDQLDGLFETCRAWAERSGDPDAVLWSDFMQMAIRMERARAVLANGDPAGAVATLGRLEPGIAAAFAENPRDTVRLTMDHGVLSALSAMAMDAPQKALAALDRAAEAQATLPDGAFSALRYGAVIAWVRADVMEALGRAEDAQASLAQGLAAAQRFAALACSDGPAILAAYQGRTVMPL